MEDRSQKLRAFFARYVAALGHVRDPRIVRAFAEVPREPFAGPAPWSISATGGYLTTPDDDPTFLYQDTLIGLMPERGINIGQPSAHAAWIDSLALVEGESVIQVGAGSGYYTAILARLVGPEGRVHAFEIDAELAARATGNLRDYPWVDVQARSGIAEDLPKADAVYVCAGTTQPSWTWIDALRPSGRLVFPLQAPGAMGGMLWIRRPARGKIWPARFLSGAIFIACSGPRDEEAGARLTAAFASRGTATVRSFRIDSPREDVCWYAGEGWWLSTDEPPS